MIFCFIENLPSSSLTEIGLYKLVYFVCLYSISLWTRLNALSFIVSIEIAVLYWNRRFGSLESDCIWENSAIGGCRRTLIQYFARYFFSFFAKLYACITFVKERWLQLCPFTSMLIMKLFVTPRLKIAFNETLFSRE